jgi:hypothetical protein
LVSPDQGNNGFGMKGWMFGALALLACAALAACHKHNDLSSYGSPAKRLAGHWITTEGDSQYYGPADATSGIGSLIAPDLEGKPLEQHYQVLNEDPSTQTLKIKVLFAGGSDREETFTLAPDGQSLTISTAPASTDRSSGRLPAGTGFLRQRCAEFVRKRATASARTG